MQHPPHRSGRFAGGDRDAADKDEHANDGSGTPLHPSETELGQGFCAFSLVHAARVVSERSPNLREGNPAASLIDQLFLIASVWD
jgi:hypothetical protein